MADWMLLGMIRSMRPLFSPQWKTFAKLEGVFVSPAQGDLEMFGIEGGGEIHG